MLFMTIAPAVARIASLPFSTILFPVINSPPLIATPVFLSSSSPGDAVIAV
jgi:hypothetical protein